MKGKSLSRVRLFATPWIEAYQARVLEWGAIAFSRREHYLTISVREESFLIFNFILKYS